MSNPFGTSLLMSVPQSVLAAYGFEGHSAETVTGGLINTTYAIKGGDGIPVAALQRLHPAFSSDVNTDIEAVADYLAAQGIATPRLLRTKVGDAFVLDDGQVWRALTWLSGSCYSRIPEASVAHQGAALVGRFHRVLDGFDYKFIFSRTGVHDTQAHLEKLRATSCEESSSLINEAYALRTEILQQAQVLPTMPELPTRICHGDLKISNLLFDGNGKGLCLIDLDTMGMQTIAYELGDALRSWGNRSGEDTSEPLIDSEIVLAAARGYAEGAAGLLSAKEVMSVITGLETVCLELAARFCTDAFEDCYFGWNAERYSSRREHNIERAKGQLCLSHSVAERRSDLTKLWASAF